MGLRDLLFYVSYSPDLTDRLRLVVELAKRHESKLTLLYIRQWSEMQLHERKVAELGLLPAADYERMIQSIKTSIDNSVELLRTAIEDFGKLHGFTIHLCVAEGEASSIVPQYARHADLCVLEHYESSSEDSTVYSFSEKLVFNSGRPVILIPPRAIPGKLGAHVSIAWNASRPAARAVSDALPVLERADRVTVLTANQDDLKAKHGALPATLLVQHLERHGVSANLEEISVPTNCSVADALQVKALSVGADLLVAGAFGHPQLWEKMLGGTTRDLLDRMIMPILMSN